MWFRKIMNSLGDFLKKLKNKGFFEIVLSSTLVKAIMFLSAMFLPRFLSVEEYGTLTYSESIVNYILMASGLGLSSATLKYCIITDSMKEKKGILYATSIVGTLFNLFVIIGACILFNLITLRIKGTNEIILAMIGLVLLSFIFQNMQIYMRANFRNKLYAILSICYTVIYVGLQILLAIFKGVAGVVMARYISYVICLILAILMLRKVCYGEVYWPSKKKILNMIKFSAALLIGNVFSMAIANNEIILVGQIFSDKTLVANYRVGAYILQICLFIVESLVLFALPHFVKNMNDKRWLWANFKKLFLGNLFVMLIFTMVLFVGAKYVILLIWGDKYLGALPIMRTLLVAAFVLTVFRAISGNILGSIGEEKYTLKINLVTCVLHISFDLFFYNFFGPRCVGSGLIVAYSFSGLCMTRRLWRVCKDGL